jgi:hypothetical protein
MTVPANIILPSITYLSVIKNYVCISELFLKSLTAGNKFKKDVNISRLLPVTFDIKKIGVTSSVAIVL